MFAYLPFAFGLVFPLLLLMLLGYSLKRFFHLITPELSKGVNKLIMRVFLPLTLFYNIYSSGVDISSNLPLVCWGPFTVLLLMLISWFFSARIEPDRKKKGVIPQSIFRANFALFGYAVADALLDGESLGAVAVLVGSVVPTYNILSTFILEYYHSAQINVKGLAKSIVLNPLVILPILGLVCVVTGFSLPAVVEKTFTTISPISTPLSLVMLGSAFNFSSIRRTWKQLICCVTSKLILAPLITIPLSLLVGFTSPEQVVAILALHAAPTATVSYTHAVLTESDAELANQIVVFTSLGSIVTVALIIALLKSLLLI